MAKKLTQLSDARKAELKASYGRIQAANEIEQSYLNKIKAGKARAANALKDNRGKYISRTLKNEVIKNLAAAKGVPTRTKANRAKQIDEITREAGITDRELKRFFDYNRDAFNSMIESGSVKSTSRNTGQIESDIEKYSGRIYLKNKDGELTKVSANKAIKAVADLKQYLSSHFNVVEIILRPELSFDGKMIIPMPDVKKLYRDVKEYFGAENLDEVLEGIEGEGFAFSETLQELINGNEDIFEEGDIILIVS